MELRFRSSLFTSERLTVAADSHIRLKLSKRASGRRKACKVTAVLGTKSETTGRITEQSSARQSHHDVQTTPHGDRQGVRCSILTRNVFPIDSRASLQEFLNVSWTEILTALASGRIKLWAPCASQAECKDKLNCRELKSRKHPSFSLISMWQSRTCCTSSTSHSVNEHLLVILTGLLEMRKHLAVEGIIVIDILKTFRSHCISIGYHVIYNNIGPLFTKRYYAHRICHSRRTHAHVAFPITPWSRLVDKQ